MATLKDCVPKSPSKWFEGPIGWQLQKPRRLEFIKLKAGWESSTRPKPSKSASSSNSDAID
jgi:hypothetical protein